jgi:hypothetical protein
VAADPHREIVELVPQRDPAEDLTTFHDPPVRAVDPAAVERCRWSDSPANRVSQVASPVGESTSSDGSSPKPS